MKIVMTKKKAEIIFKKAILPNVFLREMMSVGRDTIKRLHAWDIFKGTLFENGVITERQNSAWLPPRVCR